MRVPLFGQSSKGITISQDSRRTRNWFEDFAIDKNAKTPAALIGTPGLARITNGLGAEITTPGQTRGLYTITPAQLPGDATMLAIGGTDVSRWDPTFVSTSIGTIGNDGRPVVFAENPLYVLLCSNNRLYLYTKASGILTGPLSFSGGGAEIVAQSCAFIASYFVVAGATSAEDAGKIFYSEPGGITFAAADYFSAEFSPDIVRWTAADHNELWAFGDASAQGFGPTGDANQPFAPIVGAFIEQGIVAPRSVGKLGDSQIWFASQPDRGGLTFQRLIGTAPQRISTPFVENLLNELMAEFGINALQDAVASAYVDTAHAFYKASFIEARTTLIYDATTDRWSEGGYWNKELGRYEADPDWVHTYFAGKHIVGDRRPGLVNGGIYELSLQAPSHDLIDGETEIRREFISPHFSGPNHERLFFHNLELEFERGLATPTGQGSDPQAMVQFSDDGGKTYGNEIWLPVGPIGSYTMRCRLPSCGSAYDRVVKVAVSDPALWRFVGGFMDITRGRN